MKILTKIYWIMSKIWENFLIKFKEVSSKIYGNSEINGNSEENLLKFLIKLIEIFNKTYKKFA